MRSHGFSLIELLIVMAIAGVLLSIATLQFTHYSRKSSIESQVRMLHGDIMTVRSQAMFTRQPRSVIISSSAYSVYSSSNVSVPPLFKKDFKYSMIWNGSSGQLNFDSYGLLSNPGLGGRSICILDGGNPAALDSIVLSAARIQLGKRDEGGACVADDIKTR
ncbi:type IV pilus minor pilin FimU [Geotalea daltonii FRC-32]|uniref:Type IV pilus minor pilin FimU n=1 Tax=Geotalea daltonii (strain DSM 22248 / JCM 15807 / FRC-32) TaxID=316067 RepID=B9M3J8_GEODF|nr:prepilin-type N-terminal cleavage/methylation domain-containing protein [Geotalea daltonii]ACM21419.1 type IV pilus minor pilin FimU [Geotalea daltonii FRC-32]